MGGGGHFAVQRDPVSSTAIALFDQVLDDFDHSLFHVPPAGILPEVAVKYLEHYLYRSWKSADPTRGFSCIQCRKIEWRTRRAFQPDQAAHLEREEHICSGATTFYGEQGNQQFSYNVEYEV